MAGSCSTTIWTWRAAKSRRGPSSTSCITTSPCSIRRLLPEFVARELAPVGLRSSSIFGAASRPSGTVRRSDKLPRHRVFISCPRRLIPTLASSVAYH
ncbi:hypothetical protein EIY72_21255 [Pseudomonas vancouverensis]|uniref:Uncharacterized protein n=1 Tax=Pseudomonas vancouverensis TaxID=95300 RepID=A0A4R4JYU2_PSEVA|nr:hypothetical protein F7R09_27570 [Pseudomonas vancouverensis]TDB58829.1 hypothetical protein EIY72_21255 [Pseudomonas vancouverensis]